MAPGEGERGLFLLKKAEVALGLICTVIYNEVSPAVPV